VKSVTSGGGKDLLGRGGGGHLTGKKIDLSVVFVFKSLLGKHIKKGSLGGRRVTVSVPIMGKRKVEVPKKKKDVHLEGKKKNFFTKRDLSI